MNITGVVLTRKHLRAIARAIEYRKKAIAFDARLYMLGAAENPVNVAASEEYLLLNEALAILGCEKRAPVQ